MSNEAKVEMVPMLQDMRTYITNHYWSEMLCEVDEYSARDCAARPLKLSIHSGGIEHACRRR